MRLKKIIFTADDFGLSSSVNEAVERAHREGVLSTASLMMGAEATADAVQRARSMPDLRVGLHVVLVNGRPLLPPEAVPALVGPEGAFLTDLGEAGVRFFFRAGARRQLDAEIRAQFEAFAATGLTLDHVNAQNHMHVHPTVLTTILRVGREYGMRAVRIPHEPLLPSWRGTHFGFRRRVANAIGVAPWTALMRLRLHLAKISTNDYVFGMNDTAAMTAERILGFLPVLPSGISEIYSHPAMGDGEYLGLIDPRVRQRIGEYNLERTTFGELSDAARS
jgi:hopanoid biosynthesis associated protein HpnK